MYKTVITALLFMTFSQSCYINKFKLRPLPGNVVLKDTVHLRNILVVCYGNSATHLVAENFHQALQKRVKINGGNTTFLFKNIYQETAYTDIHSVYKEQYDGYLLLYPKDTSMTKEVMSSIPVPIPDMLVSKYSTYDYYSRHVFNDVFLTEVFDARKNLLYAGELFLKMTPSDELFFNPMSNRLIQQLKKIHIMFW